MGGGLAMRGSELDFFGLYLGFIGFAVMFLIMSVAVPVVLAGVVAVMHLRLRADRELLEGTHTVAAYGSRAGARLGMFAGLLLSGGWALVALLSVAGDRSFGFYGTLFCLAGVIPSAAWGMLSGSIAGNRSNERTAGMLGAAMFVVIANPLSGLSLVGELVRHPENFFDLLLPLLGHLVGLLVYVAAGALTGLLAVRLGRERLADGARPVPRQAVSPWVTEQQ
ncbi:MAG: hypothetical protein ACKPJD_04520 [Planctomycetaceae bacterium]